MAESDQVDSGTETNRAAALPCNYHIASMLLSSILTSKGTLTESEILTISWPLARPKIAKKIAVIQSAADAASAKGGCASSRLDQGLKFYVNRGGYASSRLISEFSDCEPPITEACNKAPEVPRSLGRPGSGYVLYDHWPGRGQVLLLEFSTA